MKKYNLIQDKPHILFARYLLPSLSSTVFLSAYVIADTMMIGHGVGQNGLVALNLLLPIFSLFFAFGYMFGVGGSVLMSVANGRGDKEVATSMFTTSFVIILALGILFTISGVLFLRPICYMIGGTEETISYMMEYGIWLMSSAAIYLFSPFFQNFIKNDEDPKRGMLASIVGSALNIVLDYIFIFYFQWGMMGAIVATIVGHIFNIGIAVSHFCSKHNQIRFQLRLFSVKNIGPIMKTGASSFVGELSAGVVILIFNQQILKYLGGTGIVVYSVISNTAIVVNALINGVASAAQPIISFNFGANRADRVRCIRKIGVATSGGIAILLYAFIYLCAKFLVYAFVVPTDEILIMANHAIRIYFLGSFALFANLYYGAYFQAVVKSKYSVIIGLLRGLILCTILVEILPKLFGGAIIWWVMPITEAITGVITMCFVIRCNKSKEFKDLKI